MNVSRRDFLKGSLAGAAALALTGAGIGSRAVEAEAAGLNSKDPAESRASSPIRIIMLFRTQQK